MAGIPIIAIDLKGDLASLGIFTLCLKPEELAPFCAEPNDDAAMAQVRAIDLIKTTRDKLTAFGLADQESWLLHDAIDGSPERTYPGATPFH